MGQGPPGPPGPAGKSGSVEWKEFDDTQKTEIINQLKSLVELKGPKGDKGDDGEVAFKTFKEKGLFCEDDTCSISKKLIFPKVQGYNTPVIQIGTENQRPDETNISSLSFGDVDNISFTGMGVIPNNFKMFPDSSGSILATNIKNGDEWGLYSTKPIDLTKSTDDTDFTNLFSVQSETGKVGIKGIVNLENNLIQSNNILFKPQDRGVLNISQNKLDIFGSNHLQFGNGFQKEKNAGQISYGKHDGRHLGSLHIIGGGVNDESRIVRVNDTLKLGNWRIRPETSNRNNSYLTFYHCENECTGDPAETRHLIKGQGEGVSKGQGDTVLTYW